MTQTLPLIAALGSAKTGLSIGYRVLNLDRTEYSAFTTTDVVESAVDGTYYVDGGIAAPDAGGYVVVGISDTDYVEVGIESAVGGWEDVLTESYAADGATATPAQLLYMILALLAEKSISGTTMTAKKLDGSTVAMTFILDSATDPTAITRTG